MHSKARFAGRAIHPMIVVFPIAFYTATVALLLAYVGTQEAFWYRVAMIANVVGILTAAVAMIPGAIDLLWLPATSRARTVGLRHAGFHALATGLFAVTALLLYRSWHHRVFVDGKYLIDATIPLAMGVIAWVSMMIAASLGWTLVQTHHVGVKSAFPRAERPSHEPGRQAHDTIVDAHDPALDPAFDPTLDSAPTLHSPATKEAPPLSMRS